MRVASPYRDVSGAIQPSSQPVVFLVDDDTSYLRAMSRLLRGTGFHVVAFSSAAEFLAMVEPAMAGCLITDLRMPGLDGMGLQQALARKAVRLPILFLTGHGDIPTTVQAMRNGAEDFLTKTAPKEALLAAVRRALARNAQDREGRERWRQLRERFGLLTVREQEVLRLVVQGKMNKEIAADLGIHERTVKLHRTGMTTKLHVHSVAELTRMAEEGGFFRETRVAVERRLP